ncbi:hypothetical protein BDV3_002992 [Batrachochytrium dendrobatidis]|uniref:F-box domain-containing protein n=1 Tax=Batrachochytrium dendrobatidis (strain JEL423) TaxID=403673 RepID=A0A177X0D6_BATDL|nr:hypothetical protein BDEG_28555 [Batrachochytrium dendrobatidis JEL423]
MHSISTSTGDQTSPSTDRVGLINLPVELWVNVLRQLPAYRLLQTRLVSRTWCYIVDATPLSVNVSLVAVSALDTRMLIDMSWHALDSMLDQPLTSCLPAVMYQRRDHLWANVRVCCNEYGFLPDRHFIMDQILQSAMTFTRGRSKLILDLQLLVQDHLSQKGMTLSYPLSSLMVQAPFIRYSQDDCQNTSNLALFNGFSQTTIINPGIDIMKHQPNTIRHLELLDLHDQINFDNISEFRYLKSIRMQSDGRLAHIRGIFRVSAITHFTSISATLTSLTLDGPWFQNMIDYGAGLIQIFKQLTNLQKLVADFDAQTLTAQVLYDLFVSLPNLTEWATLGRIDQSFWRLFRRGEASRLKRLTVGSRKYTFSRLLTGNTLFLRDLAFGILWAAPCLESLSLFLGYQSGTDMVLVLDIIKRLKEGKDWDAELLHQKIVQEARMEDLKLPEPPVYSRLDRYTKPKNISSSNSPSRKKSKYTLSSYPSFSKYSDSTLMLQSHTPPKRLLRHVNVFQAIDVEDINDAAWNYVAATHGGGPPISIVITDDVTTDGSLGRQFKQFGPIYNASI